jgi:hypothetical protein
MKMISTLVIAVAITGTARADKAQDLGKLAGELVKYADYTGPVASENADGLRQRKKTSACPALVAAAQKKLAPDDPVKSWAFARHPKQQDNTVKVADLMWFCEEYVRTIDRSLLAAIALTAVSAKHSLDNGLNDTQKQGVEGFQVDHLHATAKECTKLVDAAKASGMAADAKIRTVVREVRFDEMPALCEAIGKHADQLKAVFVEKFEKAAAKYKAIGIAGKRLEIFAYYNGMEWYLPGCKASTADPRKLKAAKRLFQWLTAPDGTITIRTYTFTGDNYSVAEREFPTEARAYAGCR